jgi:hypothetical protein
VEEMKKLLMEVQEEKERLMRSLASASEEPSGGITSPGYPRANSTFTNHTRSNSVGISQSGRNPSDSVFDQSVISPVKDSMPPSSNPSISDIGASASQVIFPESGPIYIFLLLVRQRSGHNAIECVAGRRCEKKGESADDEIRRKCESESRPASALGSAGTQPASDRRARHQHICDSRKTLKTGVKEETAAVEAMEEQMGAVRSTYSLATVVQVIHCQ